MEEENENKTIGVIVFLALIAVTLLVVYYKGDEKEKQATAVQAQKPQILEVNAMQFLKDYQTNEPEADDLYSGKVVKITGGTIESTDIEAQTAVIGIEQEITDYSDIGNLITLQIQCNWKSQQELANLTLQQKADIIGNVSQKTEDSIIIQDCMLAK